MAERPRELGDFKKTRVNCGTKGPFTPSASTSVYVRRATCVDGRRRTSTRVYVRLRT